MLTYLNECLFVLGDARRKLPHIFALSLFSAVLDLIGIGLIVPLIVAVTQNTTSIFGHVRIVLTPVQMSLFAFGVLIAFAIKGVIAYHVQKTIFGFTESHRSSVMTRLMTAYLAKPYEFFFGRNGAEMINHILYTTYQYSSGTLGALLKLVTDGLAVAVIVAFLAWNSWLAVALLMVFLVLVAGYYDRVVKNRINLAGQVVIDGSSRVIQIVSHGLGAIREVRVLGIEKYFLAHVERESLMLADMHASAAALNVVPRHVVEFSVILLIVFMALLVVWGQMDAKTLMPTIALFGVAAIRLIPGATTIMNSINSLRLNRYALAQIYRDLQDTEEANVQADFGRPARQPRLAPISLIRVDRISYTYPGSALPAVRDLSFTIRRGQAVGLIGRTGSGKSTTADILLGLLRPQEGHVLADGRDIRAGLRDWMLRCAYIPQMIFLMDGSLLANIAFGIPTPDIDPHRLNYAVKASKLEEVVAGLPDGLNTLVGDRGIRLSGGQRQRVAVARALYYDREFIVMDEATAALDTETEREVVSSIRSLQGHKTLLIIAHRLSTLAGCDQVIRLDDGCIIQSGAYDEVVKSEIEYSAIRSESVPLTS